MILAAVERLLESASSHGRPPESLGNAIRAFDIDEDHVATCAAATTATLRRAGVSARRAGKLAKAWVRRADFLLEPISRRFDFVVGNPPYLRIEQLSSALQAEYRARYASLYDRADLYVAFIECGLDLLAPAGVLSFVCADRLDAQPIRWAPSTAGHGALRCAVVRGPS